VHSLVEPTFQGGQYQLLFLWIVCGSLAYARVSTARQAALSPSDAEALPATSAA